MEIIEPLSRSSNLIDHDDCFLLMIDIQTEFMEGLEKKKKEIYLQKNTHLIQLCTV